MEVNDQLHTQATLPPGKQLLVPIEYEAGRDPETVGRFGEKNVPGIEPRFVRRPARSLVMIKDYTMPTR
jgi:hypothetical protein